jgi:hypothetical protein
MFSDLSFKIQYERIQLKKILKINWNKKGWCFKGQKEMGNAACEPGKMTILIQDNSVGGELLKVKLDTLFSSGGYLTALSVRLTGLS